MRQFSTVELVQKLGIVTEAAMREPVAITHHRRPKFVLMAMEDYQKMTKPHDPREAFLAEDMPDDKRQMLIEALERTLSDLESRDGV